MKIFLIITSFIKVIQEP